MGLTINKKFNFGVDPYQGIFNGFLSLQDRVNRTNFADIRIVDKCL